MNPNRPTTTGSTDTTLVTEALCVLIPCAAFAGLILIGWLIGVLAH